MSNKSFITRSTTGLSVAQEEDVTGLQNQINAIDTSLIVIEDKLNDLDISLGLLNNVDNSINKLDISVNFLDLSGVEFSLGINKLDISVNKLEISANKYELYEASINFLEASGVEFSLGISKLDNSVNKLEISANKYELYETSLNFLEASGNVFSLDIATIDNSCNIYEASINAITGSRWTVSGDNIAYNTGGIDVSATSTFSKAVIGNDTVSTTTAVFSHKDWVTDAPALQQVQVGGSTILNTGGTGAIYFQKDKTTNMVTIKASNGYVGIGEEVPTYALTVKGGGGNVLRLEANHHVYMGFFPKGASTTNRYAWFGYPNSGDASLGKLQLSLERGTDKSFCIHGGYVGINTATTPAYPLSVTGDVIAAAYRYTSDDRIKYNETPIGSALPIINKFKPYKYEKLKSSKNETGKWIPSDVSWNEVKNDVDLSGDRLYEYTEEIGFIAQDIRNEINDLSFCVSGEEQDASGNQTLLSVNYNNIFCLAIQAIQELDKKVNTLENEIKILKGE